MDHDVRLRLVHPNAGLLELGGKFGLLLGALLTVEHHQNQVS